jgi:hypothetical protein
MPGADCQELDTSRKRFPGNAECLDNLVVDRSGCPVRLQRLGEPGHGCASKPERGSTAHGDKLRQMIEDPEKRRLGEWADENEAQARACRAKADYCKWTASRFSDQTMRDFYAELAVEWQKAAAAYEQLAKEKRP